MDSMEAAIAIAAGVGAPPSATGAKRPQLPNNFFKFPAPARLKAIQQYINSFEYKQTPTTSFNSHKFRPLSRIMDTAKMMIYSPQPIKCVEAVFLALYLTAGMHDVDRIPLSFKTQEDNKVHQHIVLLVRYGDKYGAFGISRRTDLMNKEFDFNNVSSIVENYKRAYENHMHTVLKIRIGLPVEHNVESYNFICWRYLTVAPFTEQWIECCEELDKHAQHAKKLWEKWLIEGQGGAAKTSAFRQCVHVKKEEEFSTRSSRSSSQVSTKQVTSVSSAKDSNKRPISRIKSFKLARAEASGTGNVIIDSIREDRAVSRGRNRKLFCKQFSVAAVSRKTGSSSKKFALKGRTIELSLDSELLSGKICEAVPCRCSFHITVFK